MKVGKVPVELLTTLVYPYLGSRPDVLVHAKVGEDCAVIDFGEYVCILTTDPITGATRHLGRLAVHVACNDLAATGAEPVALLLTLLLREGTTEEELAEIMREAGETAKEVGVEIAGGHTEVTSGIDRHLAIMTALGRARKGEYVTTSGAKPGDTLILTKGAGIEGTAILASDFADDLRRHLPEDVISRAQRFYDHISVIPEGRIAIRTGVSAMHDVVEGGVLAAVWEMAEASGTGVELWADAVPIYPETQAICQALEIDPLGLISSGALLIASRSPEETLQALHSAGIPAQTIGKITASSRVIIRGNRREDLRPYPRDELWRVMEQLSL
ncbi:MAG: AIR synthase family protein [Armatimonadota bacterium]|nr:AIR synthase family protein [Armatimonadota bacterium]MDR5703722.1 AIR synthase family protein [Armatimonadota bacterium]